MFQAIQSFFIVFSGIFKGRFSSDGTVNTAQAHKWNWTEPYFWCGWIRIQDHVTAIKKSDVELQLEGIKLWLILVKTKNYFRVDKMTTVKQLILKF